MRDIKHNKPLFIARFKTFQAVVPFGMFVLPTLHLSRSDWCSGLMKQPNAMGSAGNHVWWRSPDLYALLYFRIIIFLKPVLCPMIVAVVWWRSVLGFRFQSIWNLLFFKKGKNKRKKCLVVCFLFLSSHLCTVQVVFAKAVVSFFVTHGVHTEVT